MFAVTALMLAVGAGGARGYCAAFGFLNASWFGLNELNVIGGPAGTLLLMNRTDVNLPYNESAYSAAIPSRWRLSCASRAAGSSSGRTRFCGDGCDYDTAVITRWSTYDVNGERTLMGNFFRVRNGLIVEWLDTAVVGASTASSAGLNSTACQTVNAALVSRPAASAPAGGPPPGGPAPRRPHGSHHS